MTDRRKFLKRLARGTAYAAPVIYTLARPTRLMAILPSRRRAVTAPEMELNTQSSDAPWDVSIQTTPPPWGTKPPWALPDSAGDDE